MPISQVSYLIKEFNYHILQINNIVKTLNAILIQFNEKAQFLTNDQKVSLNLDMTIKPILEKPETFNKLFINVGFKTSEGEISNYEVDYGTSIDSLLKHYTTLSHLGQKNKEVSFFFNGIQLHYGDFSLVEEVFKNTQAPTIDVKISNFFNIPLNDKKQ